MSATDRTDTAGPQAAGGRRVPVVILGMTALLGLMLAAFILPAINSGPHNVPIAVAGPAAEAQQVADALESSQPDAYDIELLPDAETAREDITNRDIYGAIVVSEGDADPQILIASSGSAQIANGLRALGPSLSGQPVEPGVTVEDLAPLPEDDPLGTGLASGATPLVLGGYVAALVIVVVLRRPVEQVATAFVFSLVGGFALTAMLQYGFGVIEGTYLLTSLGLAITLAATCWMIIGLRSVLGPRGLGLGAALLILVANPLSGLSGGKQWLPEPWGEVGQFLPPGAGGSLLRALSFFDGANIVQPLLVLTGWLIIGVALFSLGIRRAAKAGTPTAPAPGTPEPARA
ncbi:hypothetical protein [Streptomyces mayteni]